ncbi:signal peptidase II [Paenibacillus koleovorans]|uniref:signal peptidase II n=1 Tax=Paenibacillus koleovorans TaxID=121608 RepID=UPI000FD8A7CC|nr:signal peptidase II [Paenibacillus koleovorans]
MIYFLYAFLVLVLDQFTKWLIVRNLELYETIPVLGNFLSITSHRNKGAAFSILQNQRLFFLVITTFVIIGIVWYLRKVIKENRKLLPVALSLALGGALGNYIDRALFGEVVDFIQCHFVFSILGWDVDYIFPIFNVADSGVVIGFGLVFLDTLLDWRKERRGEVHELDDGIVGNGQS